MKYLTLAILLSVTASSEVYANYTCETPTQGMEIQGPARALLQDYPTFYGSEEGYFYSSNADGSDSIYHGWDDQKGLWVNNSSGLINIDLFRWGMNECARTQLIIQHRPVASFDIDTNAPVVESAIEFNASQSSIDVNAAQSSLAYLWDFGDGTTADTVTVNHSYREPGEYRVSLRVNDGVYNSFEQQQTITVAAEYSFIPETPERFIVSSNGCSTHYSWNASIGATDYVLEYKATGEIKASTAETYYITQLNFGPDIGVRACNENGCSEISISPMVPPTGPAEMTTSINDGLVNSYCSPLPPQQP